MNDEKEREPQLQPDVQETALVVRGKDEARALARRMAGESIPDECWFHCVTCGWNNTLKFDKDEIEALGGDVTSYGGPCPTEMPSLKTGTMGCGSMTLVPRDSMIGDDFRSIRQRAKENRKEEYSDAADAFIDKVQERAGAVIASAMTGAPGQAPPEKPAEASDAVPGREDLPDAGDVDLSRLKR